MPLYEYRCRRCDQRFEVRQKFSDAPLTVHEGCGGEVERLISAPTFQFKGTGWYVTDYPRGGSSAAANGSDKAGKPDGSTGATAEAKTDSKAEVKPVSKPDK